MGKIADGIAALVDARNSLQKQNVELRDMLTSQQNVAAAALERATKQMQELQAELARFEFCGTVFPTDADDQKALEALVK